MWSMIKAWGLPVTLAEVQESCETCVVYSQEHPQRPLGTTGQMVWGRVLLTRWQVNVTGPLPSSEGFKYAITCVDTATRLLAAYLACHLDQKVVIAALEHLCSTFGRPLVIGSDRWTHFTGSLVKQWAQDMQIAWKFHVAYHPQAAGMIEWHNGLLKQSLQAMAATLTWGDVGAG